jgi:hypothetical protein
MSGLNTLALSIVAVASVVSLLLLILRGLAKELESVALVWIRVMRKINAERKKPSLPPPGSLDTYSNHGSDSASCKSTR